MNVIVSDLKDTGARWFFTGHGFIVDPVYLEEFLIENPQYKGFTSSSVE